MVEVVVNSARERLARGELSLGVGVRHSRTVDIARVMATAGFDWLFLDLEHSAMPLDTASQIACAALDAGIAPIVRVPVGAFTMATRALDTGALGIVMPHIDTAAEARAVVERLRFPPLGHRSVGGVAPQLRFRDIPLREASPLLNAATLVVVMLETPTAVANAEAIAAVDGIDVLMIGTNDLTAEMGIPAEFDHPRVAEAYERVVAAAHGRGRWVGMGGVTTEAGMARYVGMGVRFVLSGHDAGFLMAAARARATALRAISV